MMPLPANRSRIRRLVYDAMLLALSLLLSYVESLLPLAFAPPGVKLGLPNVVIMFVFFHLGRTDGLLISLMRAVLVSMLFGSVASFLFSLLGALLAWCVLLLLDACGRFGRIGISCGCAAAHVIGQLVAGVLLYGIGVLSYLPYLLLASLPFGAMCGGLLFLCEKCLLRVRLV